MDTIFEVAVDDAGRWHVALADGVDLGPDMRAKVLASAARAMLEVAGAWLRGVYVGRLPSKAELDAEIARRADGVDATA